MLAEAVEQADLVQQALVLVVLVVVQHLLDSQAEQVALMD
jgi:hypothetical protein